MHVLQLHTMKLIIKLKSKYLNTQTRLNKNMKLNYYLIFSLSISIFVLSVSLLHVINNNQKGLCDFIYLISCANRTINKVITLGQDSIKKGQIIHHVQDEGGAVHGEEEGDGVDIVWWWWAA